MPEKTLLKHVFYVLCVQYSFESQAELLTEVLTVALCQRTVGVFTRNVALLSHTWCCFLKIVQSLHNKVPYF